jgi:phosphate starvation-inducible PhoH-like protein
MEDHFHFLPEAEIAPDPSQGDLNRAVGEDQFRKTLLFTLLMLGPLTRRELWAWARGKSWLAVAMAVRALQAGQVDRIVLTRPLVEAGERVGFLPGDLMAKVDPYLRPLYDALFDMVDAESAQRLLDRGLVEVAPLAFMRGRTLNNSFIILDEAQNTTPEQMKMFLTRVGFGSRVVVTGDISQVDVPDGRSGLEGLEPMLAGIDGLSFVRLGAIDVVRHRIVQDIVEAYERAGTDGPGDNGARR